VNPSSSKQAKVNKHDASDSEDEDTTHTEANSYSFKPLRKSNHFNELIDMSNGMVEIWFPGSDKDSDDEPEKYDPVEMAQFEQWAKEAEERERIELEYITSGQERRDREERDRKGNLENDIGQIEDMLYGLQPMKYLEQFLTSDANRNANYSFGYTQRLLMRSLTELKKLGESLTKKRKKRI
jgi:hypothetical protein